MWTVIWWMTFTPSARMSTRYAIATKSCGRWRIRPCWMPLRNSASRWNDRRNYWTAAKRSITPRSGKSTSWTAPRCMGRQSADCSRRRPDLLSHRKAFRGSWTRFGCIPANLVSWSSRPIPSVRKTRWNAFITACAFATDVCCSASIPPIRTSSEKSRMTSAGSRTQRPTRILMPRQSVY